MIANWRTVTKWSKNRKKVRFRADDWLATVRGISATIAGLKDRIGELEDAVGISHSRGGGADCDDFCGAACADSGGCEFSFGESGSCGAACNDGSVKLQEEV